MGDVLGCVPIPTYHLCRSVLGTATKWLWPDQSRVDVQWVWGGHLMGRNDPEARPSQSDLSPPRTQLKHDFPIFFPMSQSFSDLKP